MGQPQLWPDPWFRATLADAYCGFLFFWLWVAWREQSLAKSILWFVLIMTLGTIAMAAYLLVQLRNFAAVKILASCFPERYPHDKFNHHRCQLLPVGGACPLRWRPQA